jgi:hypothetical protein
MAYRDDRAPLEERYESLSNALDEVRSQSRALSRHEAQLASELEAVRARLEPDRRHLALANVRIASPCPARTRRARALVASMLGTGACALLSLTAIARVMASEISPFEIHPVTPIDVAAPVTSPVAEEPDPQSNALSGSASPSDSTSMGFVWVEGLEGTRVFEGERFLGTAPLMVPMEAGLHVFRAIHPKSGKTTAALANVRPRDVTTVVVDFEGNAPKVEQRRLRMGAMSADPTNTL